MHQRLGAPGTVTAVAAGEAPTGDTQPEIEVSVVIPVRNGATTIAAQLDALAKQEGTVSWELIVADNGSTDATVSIVRAHPVGHDVDVRVVDAARARGTSVARNIGIAAANGRSVLLCDADDEVGPGWLQAHADALASMDEGLTAGPMIVTAINDPRLLGWGVPLTEPERFADGQPYGWGGNMGLARAVWEQLGGFDESWATGFDDIEFFARAFRAARPFRWVDDAAVDYRIARGVRVNLRKAFDQGRNDVRFRDEFPQTGEGSRPAATVRDLPRIITLLPRFGAVLSRAWRRGGAVAVTRETVYRVGMMAESTRRDGRRPSGSARLP